MQTPRLAIMVAFLLGVSSVSASAELPAFYVAHGPDLQMMLRAVTFQLVAVEYVPNDLGNLGLAVAYLDLRISIRNNSSKDLQLMTGGIQFNDANGMVVDTVRIDNEVVIKANSTLIGTIRKEYNPYESQNVRLRNAKMSDIRTVSYPEGMYFTDGVLLGSLVMSKYCRRAEHRGRGPCDFVAHPIQ